MNCLICRGSVPKKKQTPAGIQKNIGLCSNKCSKIAFEQLGYPIPNRYGKLQFPTEQHYNTKLTPFNRLPTLSKRKRK